MKSLTFSILIQVEVFDKDSNKVFPSDNLVIDLEYDTGMDNIYLDIVTTGEFLT